MILKEEIIPTGDADPRMDFRIALQNFDLAAYLRLAAATLAGRLMRRQYVSSDGEQGCLLHFLCGARTRDEMVAAPYLSPEIFAACRRTIRWWDMKLLDEQTVTEELAAAIQQRMEANQAEDATLSGVLQRLTTVAVS